MNCRDVTDPAFGAFGECLRAGKEEFQTVFSAPDAPGWQVGLLRVIHREAPGIHRHLNTDECFSPIRGRTVMLVAPPDAPDEVQAFHLTEPVRINTGVWHTCLTPDEPALVFVCESGTVESETHHWDHRVACPQ
jgi:hypothetical protein